MIDYINETEYYEPTQGDEIFREARDKLEKALKSSIKSKYGNLEEKEKRIAEQRKKLADDMRELSTRENTLINKEAAFKRKANEGFVFDTLYKMQDELVKKRYRIFYNYEYGPKCQYCDDVRELQVTHKNGTKATISCKCAKQNKIWKFEELDSKVFVITDDLDDRESSKVTLRLNCELDQDNYGRYKTRYVNLSLHEMEDDDEPSEPTRKNYQEIVCKSKEEAQAIVDRFNEEEKAIEASK